MIRNFFVEWTSVAPNSSYRAGTVRAIVRAHTAADAITQIGVSHRVLPGDLTRLDAVEGKPCNRCLKPIEDYQIAQHTSYGGFEDIQHERCPSNGGD